MALGQNERKTVRRGRADLQIDTENARDEPIRQHIRGPALRHDAPRPHDDKIIRIGRREIEIVQNREHGRSAVRDIPRGIHERQLMTQVEACDRLIQKQRLTLLNRSAGLQLAQCARELRALLFATGQGLVSAVGKVNYVGC